MKNIFKKLMCVSLCLMVVFSSLGVVALGAGDYPDGVTAQQAADAVKKTDNLLKYMVPMLTGESLSSAVKNMIYTDDSLSGLVMSIYSSFGEDASALDVVGISVSTTDVAAALADYPSVSEAIAKASDWSTVDLTGAKWGVSDKNGFATAVGKAFSPFNDLLYTLLCSGSYSLSGIISIKGDDGYTNAIVPMLQSLKCKNIMSSADFKAQADKDKSNMVKNILLPVLTVLEDGFNTPADTFTDVLPSFAYFVESGEMDACMDKLLSPITSNPLFQIASFLKIFDLEALEFDINALMQDAGEGSFKMAPLDFARLAACGNYADGQFVSDKGRAYVEVLRWLVDSLKLNKDTLPDLVKGEGTGMQLSPDMLSGMMDKDTEVIVKTIILLFNPAEPGAAQGFEYPAITPAHIQYTPNLTVKDYERVLNEIDPLLDEFVKEGGSYKSVESLLASAIYSGKNITALLKGIYGSFEKEGIADILVMMGIDITPKGIAASLGESNYATAANALRKAGKWADVSDNLYWGFSDGSRVGFENALIAVMKPVYPVLRVLLADKDLTLLNSITLKGADGYNTAIIPLLEALGCKASSIKTYSEYLKTADSDGVLRAITTPVFDMLDDLFKAPVSTLTRVLPNIVYFMDSGSFEKTINNLLIPLTAFTENLSGVIELNLDTSSLSEFDLNGLLGSLLENSGIKIAEFDLKTLSNIGTLTEKISKRTLDGKNVKYSYVEADRTGVLMTFLRVLAKTIKMPGNENLLTGSIGGGNAAFETYSSSIGEQFATMTEDELIEWLYNLLFKERAQVEIVVDDNYVPTIIFKENEPNYIVLYGLGAFAFLGVAVGAILYFNRKKIFY